MFAALLNRESSAPAGLEELRARLDREEFDLIAVGRVLLADPEWATKIRADALSDLQGFTPAALAHLY